MEQVKIQTEFIKLDQFLKWVDVVGSGVEAKFIIKDGVVKVNDEVETRRGKKLYPGDVIEVSGKRFQITN
jgi:ribosome-associated protein